MTLRLLYLIFMRSPLDSVTMIVPSAAGEAVCTTSVPGHGVIGPRRSRGDSQYSSVRRSASQNRRSIPAPGVRLTRGLDRTKKTTTSRAVPQPFFTLVRRPRREYRG